MQIQELIPTFNELQKRFGDPKLSSIYGAGYLQNPEICFVFMNPTGKNVAADLKWHGLRAPWIGTKNVWKLFSKLNLISNDLFQEIQMTHASDWSSELARRVYQDLYDRKLYIKNLSKSTQTEARPLPNSVNQEHLPEFHKEISILRPKRIITFGNQVSSVVLAKLIKVSEVRKKLFHFVSIKRRF